MNNLWFNLRSLLTPLRIVIRVIISIGGIARGKHAKKQEKVESAKAETFRFKG